MSSRAERTFLPAEVTGAPLASSLGAGGASAGPESGGVFTAGMTDSTTGRSPPATLKPRSVTSTTLPVAGTGFFSSKVSSSGLLSPPGLRYRSMQIMTA